MQPLPKGVTGFDAPDDGVEVKRFTAACHAAVRQIGGQVHQVRPAYEQIVLNFHEAFVTLRGRPEIVRILCNAHYPMVAFARPAAREGDARLEFMDCPELADCLRADFAILTRQEACGGVADELVGQLSEDELRQVNYWRPQRMGDVVFNYWD